MTLDSIVAGGRGAVMPDAGFTAVIVCPLFSLLGTEYFGTGSGRGAPCVVRTGFMVSLSMKMSSRTGGGLSFFAQANTRTTVTKTPATETMATPDHPCASS